MPVIVDSWSWVSLSAIQTGNLGSTLHSSIGVGVGVGVGVGEGVGSGTQFWVTRPASAIVLSDNTNPGISIDNKFDGVPFLRVIQ